MTDIEIIWLARTLPRPVVKQISTQCDDAVADWSLPQMPRQCITAVQIVTIEMGLIQAGALKILGRLPADRTGQDHGRGRYPA